MEAERVTEQRAARQRVISLRGVAVHNLKGVDLDLPHSKLIVFCGVSGSGKSSLAFDTLYAEGQRRYIESFSAYTRQFLERLEKPGASRIDGIPPSVAVMQRNSTRSSRSTVGTATETNDHLRLLFAKIGRLFCMQCGREVRRETSQSTSEFLAKLPHGTRYLVAFERHVLPGESLSGLTQVLREDAFMRSIVKGQTLNLADRQLPELSGEDAKLYVIVDRLTAGATAPERIRDSLETAFQRGYGQCQIFLPEGTVLPEGTAPSVQPQRGWPFDLDGQPWRRLAFSTRLRCDDCGLEYPAAEARLFSFNHPLGACPECEGFGNVVGLDMDLVVPDPLKTLREGAIAPWNTPSYAHELEELIALTRAYQLPLDVPYAELNEAQKRLIHDGVPQRKFGGLRGFFAWLERKKYKMHVRVFLSRWRSYTPCPMCHGARLRAEALAWRIGGKNIAELASMKIRDISQFIGALELSDWEREVGRTMLDQLKSRLGYLEKVSLGYLPLDRPLRTLSGGESQRVGLTAALGSSLVNMLYVLDEPSMGLHPHDTVHVIEAISDLRDRLNTVVVVDHDEAVIRSADQVVEIGPGAGDRGGQVVFQGTPSELERSKGSLTGDYLAGRRMVHTTTRRRTPNHGHIRLAGARGNNLRNLTVDFPLGMLCVVTGLSGSGKSTLVQDTLYPALCRRKRKDAPKPYPYDDVFGDGQLDDVILVDQSPLGRSSRSNPVTYVKAFDEIRAVFAGTLEARTRNYTASHFSFNVEGGRCETCKGEGHIEIDMQFLANVNMKCGQCQGRRFRAEILEAKYRDRNIAEVLDMTVREGFNFFRGQAKVQARLKRLMDVGLDYLRLGQPANTLSGGEAQRLKLAAHLTAAKRGRSLFLLDEPTTGLHFYDVVQLLDCFEALLEAGHSLIVVEHSLQLMAAADYIIDLGPGAADEGGRVVATGTPEMIANNKDSITGGYLAKVLATAVEAQPA